MRERTEEAETARPPRPASAAPAIDLEPPRRRAEPPRAAPEPEPQLRPEPAEATRAARERAARQLAIEYLAYWSAPNAVALDATPDFYAPRVEFHGRTMGARALFEEKRRFVQRWPLRSYGVRDGTARASCELVADTCLVRTVFDFAASHPDRGRRSQGVAQLELRISFAGPRPVIVSETSRVLASGRGARSAFEDADD